MKRAILFIITGLLVASLAAPSGAAFATEEGVEQAPVSPAILPEPQVEQLSLGLAAPPTSPTVVTPSPTPTYMPPQRKVYVTAFQSTAGLGFVELYNSDSTVVSLANWRLQVDYSDSTSCTAQLSGYIFAKSRVVLKQVGTLPMATNAHEYQCGSMSQLATTVSLYDGDQLIEQLEPTDATVQFWARINTTSTYTTGNFTKDFKAASAYTVTDGYWYVPPSAPPVQILEVLVNPRACIPPDESVDCYDYIKLKNTSDQPVDLADYRLRSGYSNASSSNSNTEYLSLLLQPGEVRTITHDASGERVAFSANDGTMWFEDAEGVVAYPTTVPAYIGSDLTSKKGWSWAYDPILTSWRWGVPSPESEANTFVVETLGKGAGQDDGLQPCAADQYRNPETNRCKKIDSASSLTPCKEGQYRSEETNRCRSIALAASARKACADDQFRNPLTNRCKKIASVEELADCGEGRERNPVTNRCRNTVQSDVPAAAFAVEPIEQTGSAFAGWWALGGVLMLALAYAGWEWRYEIRDGVRKIIPTTGRGK